MLCIAVIFSKVFLRKRICDGKQAFQFFYGEQNFGARVQQQTDLAADAPECFRECLHAEIGITAAKGQ